MHPFRGLVRVHARAVLASFVVIVSAAAGAPARAQSSGGGGDVINPGTRSWVQAARTGRADMLILGDSVVWHYANGWDAGFNRAFAASPLALAGTGLATGAGDGVEGDGWYTASTGQWQQGAALAPAARQGYAIHGTASTVPGGSGGNRGLFMGVDPGTIPTKGQGYDWHVYAAAPPAGGSTGFFARDGEPGYGVRQVLPRVAVNTPAGPGLQRLTAHFDEPPAGVAGVRREFFLNDPSDMTVFYNRAVATGATGVTVSSWGLGGQSAREFLTSQWQSPSFSPAGRQTYLNNLVDGGSGKLNVLIAEGFNDRHEQRPSLGKGLTPGDSPAAFRDNIEAIVAAVRGDWQAAGRDLGDLSFTLLGMYRDAYEPADRSGDLWAYGQALAAYAATDPQVSYVGLWDKAPAWDEGAARGYFFDMGNGQTDPIHPSRAGAIAYSGLVVDALLVPEPTGLAAIGLAAAGLLARRRRRPDG